MGQDIVRAEQRSLPSERDQKRCHVDRDGGGTDRRVKRLLKGSGAEPVTLKIPK